MIIDDEILFKLTELFAGIWGWLMTIAVASFILTEPEKYPVFSWVYEWL